ncbi:Bax inhibitor-1 family protein [Candidatus Peribacteria bacterium]|nr:MAG: Bax inhibitor-1 family protein [Candidatus Peribacteria bacterium]
MQQFSTSSSRPIVFSSGAEAQVYFLFAIAMGLTALGTLIGIQTFQYLSSPLLITCVIVELLIILTASMWTYMQPLKYILFAVFPFLSGFTFTPYIMSILANYVNGGSILLNACISTALMAMASAVFAKTTAVNLSGFGRFLFFAVLGLLSFGILQIFFPGLRTPQLEMLLSGAGILVFAGFTAYDLQRIQTMSRHGQNPFLLAINLYLDIFNLFLYIVRFMLAISGDRR